MLGAIMAGSMTMAGTQGGVAQVAHGGVNGGVNGGASSVGGLDSSGFGDRSSVGLPVDPGSPTHRRGFSGGSGTHPGHHRRGSSFGGSGGAVLHQGYLLKRSSNLRADWKRRFFVLDALGHLTYYRDKDGSSGFGAAKETVRLLTATIKPDLEDSPNMRFCFRVVSPEREYCLQAENQADRARWMEAVSTAIAGLLSVLI